MKNKVKDSNLLSVCDLPKEDIKNLGLSYRDIGIRLNKIIKQYSVYNIDNDDEDLIEKQQKLRRELSNWVNNPDNLVNNKKVYIGKKFGARITISLTDGLVIHDVQTFCRDVQNKNNRILGKNNFIFIKNENVPVDVTNKQSFVYSTLNDLDVLKNTQYIKQYAFKVHSSTLPSSNSNSDVLQYSPNDTSDGDVVTIVPGEQMDLHTTRREVIQATSRRYGYTSRVSKTVLLKNHYVCKYIEGVNEIYCRLSYFEYPAPTILDVAAENGRFTKLITAVKAARLVETLSSPGPFTVFAPTDEAFNKSFTESQLADLLKPENLTQLKKLLTCHVVDGKVMAADVMKLSFAKTLADGLNVSIRVENGKVFVNDSEIITKDIPCANGVIHVIDTVLSPETTTYDLLVGSKKFTKLIAALNTGKLDDILSSTTLQRTVFAPTDEAFNKSFTESQLTELLENKNKLKKLLKYHIVHGKVMAADINAIADGSGSTDVTTLEGQKISISMENGNVILNNNAKVTITDVLGSNGILVHVIDTVLIIPPVI